MAGILFVSQRENEICRLRTLLDSYGFDICMDASIQQDFLNDFDMIIFDEKFPNVNAVIKRIRAYNLPSILILFASGQEIDAELLKHVNSIVTEDMSDNIIISMVSVNLRTKKSLQQLSQTNKNLADSLYRLNVLYSTSSQFAGTLDKKLLVDYMIEGLDKSLSFDLTCTLTCVEAEPVLILNSVYDISEELQSAIKMRMVLNYKSLFENADPPYVIDVENLKVVKNIKYQGNKLTFSLFEYDTMFAPISLGDNFFGCVEIFKKIPFSTDDATCFQTIVQQVSLPLKSASLYQKIIDTNEKLEKLQRVKSEFISIVSHELRTPLTSIKNSLNIISRGGRCGELTESGKDFLFRA